MNAKGKISAAILIILCLASLLGPWLAATGAAERIDLNELRLPPSAEHPLGTDRKGRDILSRMTKGGRLSLGITAGALIISMTAGMLIGLFSGYFGGPLDSALMAGVDLFLAFPSLLLAIGISVIFPPGILTVVIAIAAVGWAAFARLIRGHVLQVREEPYVEAARAMGAGHLRVLFVHIAPQCIPLLIVMGGVKASGFLLTEAALSFLGLGPPPPAPTWGGMVSAGRAEILSAPWMVVFPGLAIAVTALALNLLGDSLSEKEKSTET